MIVDNPITEATTLIASSSGLVARATVLAANYNSPVIEPPVLAASMLCHQFFWFIWKILLVMSNTWKYFTENVLYKKYITLEKYFTSKQTEP